MKKVLALAAAAALAAGASAFAANPFSDVSTSDWAYQAVSDLSDQGIVEGYPDGTFKGETNITRYELAQIVARLMAKEDQYSAEQRATIDKLAGEYADELASLGVRVSNLEKKVGNLSFSGDARMRYQDLGNNSDSWNGRVRLNVKGQVNENTTVVGRLTTHMNFTKEGKDNGNTDTHMDQLYVNHKFGDAVALRLGRFPVAFGDQGGWLFNTNDGFDGAEVSAYLSKDVKVAVGFGQLNFNVALSNSKNKGIAGIFTDSTDVLYAKANANLHVAQLGLDYLASKSYGNDTELYGANLTVPVGEFRVFGDYWKNTTTSSKYDEAWNAGLAYGKLNLKKAGSFDVSVAYNDVDSKVYFGGTGLQTSALNYVKGNDTNVTFWNAIANVTLQKNVFLHAEYAFDVDAENAKNEDDSWTVSLNYVF